MFFDCRCKNSNESAGHTATIYAPELAAPKKLAIMGSAGIAGITITDAPILAESN